MSSLAQDELGHAAALYGLLAELTGDRRRRARLRSCAGRLPARPLARSRPRRLGDDDRPALPVRDGRRRPARGARRRSWAPLAELVGKIRREERYHLMHIDDLARAAGRRRRRAARAADRRAGDAGPGCGDRVHAAPRRAGPGRRRASSPDRWPTSKARWRAASSRCSARLDLPMPPPTAGSRRGAGPTTARRSAGSTASSRRSPQRPGATGERALVHSIASARPEPPGPVRRRGCVREPSPRSRSGDPGRCRWSISGSSTASRSAATASTSRSCRRSSAVRRSTSSAASIGDRLGERSAGRSDVETTFGCRGRRTGSRRPAGRAPRGRPASHRPADPADVRCPYCCVGATS